MKTLQTGFWRGKWTRVAAIVLGGSALIAVLVKTVDRKIPAGAREGPSHSGGPLVVLDYGPRSAVVGQGFNVQPDGKSAMWFRIKGGREPMAVVFAGESLRGSWHAEKGLVTVALDGEKLAKEGTREIRLCVLPRDVCSAPIYFPVLPSGGRGSQRAQPLVVLDYGPRSAVVGRGFNVQPDGKSAMWFRVKGGREPITVVFAGENLQGFWHAKKGLVTVALDEGRLAKEGTREIKLCDFPGGVCSAPIYLRIVPPG